jgi:hypothetical protein
VVTVALDAGWSPGHGAAIRGALGGAWLPGVAVRFVAGDADVVVRHAWFVGCRPAADYADGVIRWDPACTPGVDAATHALRHEVMHHLRCRHLCRRAGDDDCVGPPVGLALMNPWFDVPDDVSPRDKACCAPGAIVVDPTPADLAELARALGR